MHQSWNPHLSEDGIGVDPEYQDKGEPVRASNIPCNLSSIVGASRGGHKSSSSLSACALL